MSQPLAPQIAVLFGWASHTIPHLPQFVASSSLTQLPPHELKPASQAIPQLPLLQVALPLATPAQAVSQLWQWAGSLAVSTQAPPQLVVPFGQFATHLPLEQASSAAQGLSHPPQLPWLLLVSMQADPHNAKP
jgi:hypothetical protein